MKQWINNLTLAKKMLVLYIAGILVPILFLSWLSTALLQFFVDRREDENLRTAMIRVAYSIENAVVSAKNLAIICGSDEEVMDIVSRKYLGYGDFYDSYNEEITSRLLKYDQAVDDVEGIEIYSDNPTLLNSAVYRKMDGNERMEEYRSRYEDGEGSLMLVSGLEFDHTMSGNSVRSPSISVLYWMKQGEFLISVKADLSMAGLYSIVYDGMENYVYMLINPSGEIVVSSGAEYEPVNIEELAIFDETIWEGKEYQIIPAGEDQLMEGWQIAAVRMERGYGEQILLLSVPLVAGLICLLIGTIVTWQMTSSYTKRMHLLAVEMSHIRDNEFPRISTEPSSDEVGSLIESFNNMSARLETLVNDVYALNMQKKEMELEQVRAQLNQLISQVNPHFLFNTLNAVLVVCMRNKYTEIIWVIRYLSKMMLNLLNGKEELIPLHEELEFIQMYLEIEKLRFGDRISYSIETKEDVMDCILPKMSIQPLVENACKHGIQKMEKGGQVRIAISRSEGNIRVQVADSGSGMSAQRLMQVEAGLTQSAAQSSCIGLRNVYTRLRLYYGADMEFKIESELGKGTSVTFGIPEKREERQNDPGNDCG